MSAILKSLMVFALGVALMGSAATAQEGILRIGYACSNFGDLFQQYVLGAARDAAESGGDIILDRDAAEDLATQESQVAELLAAGVDALVVARRLFLRRHRRLRRRGRANALCRQINRRRRPHRRSPGDSRQ
ncbi:MAG: hypothetical protein LIP18_02465 [Planctomycetes bacterium]|nr:hypothetical protein [Planctomycetota bacterium]